jgi:hypothetical protein
MGVMGWTRFVNPLRRGTLRCVRLLARFTSLAVVVASFLIAVAALAGWGRSLAYSDYVRWSRTDLENGRTYNAVLWSASGVLGWHYSRMKDSDSGDELRRRWMRVRNVEKGDHEWKTLPSSSRAAIAMRRGEDGRENAWHRQMGFDVRVTANSALGRAFVERRYVLSAPYWFIVLLVGALPAWRFWRCRRSRRQARAGFCSNCGYDLRASPDRCPECGTPTT